MRKWSIYYMQMLTTGTVLVSSKVDGHRREQASRSSVGRPGLLLLSMREGLGAAAGRIVSCCTLSPAFLFQLCPFPSLFPFQSQEFWFTHHILGQQHKLCLQNVEDLNWFFVCRKWRIMFIQFTYKCRLAPEGFSFMALSSYTQAEFFSNANFVAQPCKGSPVIHILTWYSALTLLQRTTDPQI